MSLHAKREKTPSTKAHSKEDHPSIWMVHGPTLSFRSASIPPGFKSQPLHHNREQYHYAISGQAWIFIGSNGYLINEGDFCRVPAGAVHWVWNNSAQPAVWMEVQTPRHPEEDLRKYGSKPLYGESESQEQADSPPTFVVDRAAHGCDEIEKKAMARAEQVRTSG